MIIHIMIMKVSLTLKRKNKMNTGIKVCFELVSFTDVNFSKKFLGNNIFKDSEKIIYGNII